MDFNRLVQEAQNSNIEILLLDKQGLRPAPDGELNAEAIYSAKRWLIDNDLIADESYGGSFGLNYDGQRLAAALHQKRTSGERRWDVVTREVAQIVENDGDVTQRVEADGLGVTDKERDIAIERLEKWGLVGSSLQRLASQDCSRDSPAWIGSDSGRPRPSASVLRRLWSGR